MPTRAAHRAALRRSREPGVIAPSELPELPRLPTGCGWRNPLRGYDFDRNEWELYQLDVVRSTTLARIKRRGPDCFALAVPGSPEFEGSAVDVFGRAMARAKE